MTEALSKTGAASSERMPPELREALIDLLAQALVAELLETKNSAETQSEQNPTDTSPSGHVRNES